MSAPTYTLSEVDSSTDFPALIACEWKAFEAARIHLFRLWCPIHGPSPDTPSAHAESLAECTARQRQWHLNSATSHWLKVSDADGKIVGGALWKDCASGNPAEHEDFSDAYWYPEGGAREFVTQTLDLYDAPRKSKGRRPHWFLYILFVDPAHQRKGVATQLVRWGVDKADESQMECWLNASKYGKALYENFGFVMVHSEPFRPYTETPDEGWERMAKEFPTLGTGAMWRSVGGKEVQSGERLWEQGL